MSFYSYNFNYIRILKNKINFFNIYQFWNFDFFSLSIIISNLSDFFDEFLWQAFFILRLFTGKNPFFIRRTFKLDFFTIRYLVEFNIFFKRKFLFIYSLYFFRRLLKKFFNNQIFIRFLNLHLFIVILDLKHLQYLDLKKELYKWTNVLFISLYFFNFEMLLANKILFLNSLYFFYAISNL